MRLEDIGFYTLEDERARNSCSKSPLWRNEIIITSRCNFACPYCRGTEIDGIRNADMPLDQIKKTIDLWAINNIQNVRFSGGEPTIHKDIKEIIRYTKETCKDIKHIAISTNGYSSIELYKELIELGVNDFSISLDACCASIGDIMSGGVKGSWSKVVENIKILSKLTYVTVGMVFDKQNASEMLETIKFAHDLGVADIRIISAAQWNDFSIFKDLQVPAEIVDAHPILKYRLKNFRYGRNVRGIKSTDSHKCGMILDETIMKGKWHYPCVIKMREGCQPIGEINENIREDREKYFHSHNCYTDPICNKNCLDICVDYNNTFLRMYIEKSSFIPSMNSGTFHYQLWEGGSIHTIIGSKKCIFENILDSKEDLLKVIIGYTFADNLKFRPKENHVAVMCWTPETEYFWFHLRNNEFFELIKDIK